MWQFMLHMVSEQDVHSLHPIPTLGGIYHDAEDAKLGLFCANSIQDQLQVTELLALRRSKAEEEAVFQEMEQLRAQVGEASCEYDVTPLCCSRSSTGRLQ